MKVQKKYFFSLGGGSKMKNFDAPFIFQHPSNPPFDPRQNRPTPPPQSQKTTTPPPRRRCPRVPCRWGSVFAPLPTLKKIAKYFFCLVVFAFGGFAWSVAPLQAFFVWQFLGLLHFGAFICHLLPCFCLLGACIGLPPFCPCRWLVGA